MRRQLARALALVIVPILALVLVLGPGPGLRPPPGLGTRLGLVLRRHLAWPRTQRRVTFRGRHPGRFSPDLPDQSTGRTSQSASAPARDGRFAATSHGPGHAAAARGCRGEDGPRVGPQEGDAFGLTHTRTMAQQKRGGMAGGSSVACPKCLSACPVANSCLRGYWDGYSWNAMPQPVSRRETRHGGSHANAQCDHRGASDS